AITDDGRGIATALSIILEESGYKTKLVEEIRPGTTQAILLDGLRTPDTVQDMLTINRKAFQHARALAPSAATFITVQDTGGDFGLSATSPPTAWLGGLPGLTKPARLE